MTSRADTSNPPEDVKFVPRGLGMLSSTFVCGACAKPRPILGRRMKHVLGLRQYVCAGCAR